MCNGNKSRQTAQAIARDLEMAEPAECTSIECASPGGMPDPAVRGHLAKHPGNQEVHASKNNDGNSKSDVEGHPVAAKDEKPEILRNRLCLFGHSKREVAHIIQAFQDVDNRLE